MLKGKIALVTGASKGIGKAIAIGFARSGAEVIINYNSDKSGAANVENEIKKFLQSPVHRDACVIDKYIYPAEFFFYLLHH